MPLSKRNRRGLLILLIIGLIVSYTPRIIAANSADNTAKISFEEIEKVEKEIKFKKDLKKKKKKNKWKPRFKKAPHSFDPNAYEMKDWLALGLSEKQSNVVMKFSKFGLKSNEDLKKIFVIPEELYNLIKDSTFYPEIKILKKEYVKLEEVILTVDINTAEVLELRTLSGIGEYYATKIVEYRTELGGFNNSQQLLEIWNFGQERLDKISSRIYMSSDAIGQLDINSVTFEELSLHPYISYKVANSIVKMRAAHGNYSSVDGILKSKLISHELYLKIKMYLKV